MEIYIDEKFSIYIEAKIFFLNIQIYIKISACFQCHFGFQKIRFFLNFAIKVKEIDFCIPLSPGLNREAYHILIVEDNNVNQDRHVPNPSF